MSQEEKGPQNQSDELKHFQTDQRTHHNLSERASSQDVMEFIRLLLHEAWGLRKQRFREAFHHLAFSS